MTLEDVWVVWGLDRTVGCQCNRRKVYSTEEDPGCSQIVESSLFRLISVLDA